MFNGPAETERLSHDRQLAFILRRQTRPKIGESLIPAICDGFLDRRNDLSRLAIVCIAHHHHARLLLWIEDQLRFGFFLRTIVPDSKRLVAPVDANPQTVHRFSVIL